MNAGFFSSTAYKDGADTVTKSSTVTKKSAVVKKSAAVTKKDPRTYHLKLAEVEDDSGDPVQCIIINGRATKYPTRHAIALYPSYIATYGRHTLDYEWIEVSTSAAWIKDAVKKASAVYARNMAQRVCDGIHCDIKKIILKVRGVRTDGDDSDGECNDQPKRDFLRMQPTLTISIDDRKIICMNCLVKIRIVKDDASAKILQVRIITESQRPRPIDCSESPTDTGTDTSGTDSTTLNRSRPDPSLNIRGKVAWSPDQLAWMIFPKKLKKGKSMPPAGAFTVAESFKGEEWRLERERLYDVAVACYNDLDGTKKDRLPLLSLE